jgi:hypothetical protein
MIATNRRDFIRNTSLLSAGVSLGFLPTIFATKAFLSTDLNKNWAHFTKKMGGQSLSLLQDKTFFESQKHAADFSKFRFEWGEPVYFKDANVVARPLWKYWDTNETPQDVTILFWEEKGNWQHIASLNSMELKAMAHLSDDFTEGVLLPRFGETKLSVGHHTAVGKVEMKAIHSKKDVFTQVKIWQNGQCLADKKINFNHLNNLV